MLVILGRHRSKRLSQGNDLPSKKMLNKIFHKNHIHPISQPSCAKPKRILEGDWLQRAQTFTTAYESHSFPNENP